MWEKEKRGRECEKFMRKRKEERNVKVTREGEKKEEEARWKIKEQKKVQQE